ncbi:MAG: hypothetical protein EOP10_02520 [Proteobacteria bacterium]|nr:MAG: hypothetical protein EOP10_02520 [Pseudomonadota bacterium]
MTESFSFRAHRGRTQRVGFGSRGFFLFVFFLFALGSCRMKESTGEILVRAPNPGNFEIYRIESEDPLQFISEQVGSYNQPLTLPAGHYLILADCSYENVILRPSENRTLVAHQVIFNPPVSPQPDDNFSIQCNRFAKTKSRQQFDNRYTLNILHGTRDLLVGMVPMTIKFDDFANHENPQLLSYNLSGMRVNAYDGMKPKTSFFISPVNGLLSVTETQEFGHWQFLLAGQYRLEVNGTSMDVNLKEGEQLEVAPAFLRVDVSESVNLNTSSNILGTPSYVELNGGHWLDLNETYPVLPGTATLKMNGSLKEHIVDLVSSELTEKKVRSVLVDLDCSPWDWSCLGSRDVYLYETDKSYPFAQGITDVPLLFFEDDAWVSLQGSRDIRTRVTSQQDSTYKVGRLKLVPRQFHRHGQITDLSRIEAIGSPTMGRSLDLSVEDATEMPLIVGRYYLSQYNAVATNDWERRANRMAITVSAGSTEEIPFTVYVSEKKLKAIHEKQALARQRRIQEKYRLTQWRYRSIVPSQVH